MACSYSATCHSGRRAAAAAKTQSPAVSGRTDSAASRKSVLRVCRSERSQRRAEGSTPARRIANVDGSRALAMRSSTSVPPVSPSQFL